MEKEHKQMMSRRSALKLMGLIPMPATATSTCRCGASKMPTGNEPNILTKI